MQSRSYEQTIAWLRITFFKILKMSHDGLAFVKPLIARCQHSYFADCVKFFIKTFDVSYSARRGICGLVVIADGSIWLDAYAVVYYIQGNIYPFFKFNRIFFSEVCPVLSPNILECFYCFVNFLYAIMIFLLNFKILQFSTALSSSFDFSFIFFVV